MKYLELDMKHEELVKSLSNQTHDEAIQSKLHCEKCGKSFDNNTKMEKHKKLHCDVCGEIFKTVLQLKKHETSSGHY